MATGALTPYSSAWLSRQRDVVRTKLPSNTVELVSDGWLGWCYWITDRFGNRYAFWVAYDVDRALWATYLLHPDPSEITAPGAPPPSPHDIHLYPSRELCLTCETGCRAIDIAYSRSVLWATGISCYRAGVGFQFNVGQAW